MLSRFDPFREMVTMRKAMDRLIDNSFSDDWNSTNEWGLPLDVVEDENDYLVKASIPGINPDDLDITYSKGLLTIKGGLKDESQTNSGQYLLKERRYGTFTRTISLPTTVKSEDIQANYKDGILTLKVPKSEEVKPRRIPIQSSGQNKVIEAKSGR